MAARIDANHTAIVDALRRCGCSVESLAQLGGGVPDLLIGVGGMNVLAEIKDGTRPESERRLTPMQKDWHAAWRGKVVIIYSVAQALDLVSYLKGRIRRPVAA